MHLISWSLTLRWFRKDSERIEYIDLRTEVYREVHVKAVILD